MDKDLGKQSKEFTDSFLNEIERDALRMIADNATMLGAIKKILLSGAYYNGTLEQGVVPRAQRNFALSLAFDPTMPDDVVGNVLKVNARAIALVENGFDSVLAYKTQETPKVSTKNEAR